jgi:hypothetical protein
MHTPPTPTSPYMHLASLALPPLSSPHVNMAASAAPFLPTPHVHMAGWPHANGMTILYIQPKTCPGLRVAQTGTVTVAVHVQHAAAGGGYGSDKEGRFLTNLSCREVNPVCFRRTGAKTATF